MKHSFIIPAVIFNLINMISLQVLADEDYYFSSFGQKGLSSINLDVFRSEESILSSHHSLDVYINEVYVGRHFVYLYKDSNNKITPCLKNEHVDMPWIKVTKWVKSNNDCVDIEKSIEGSTIKLDFSMLEVYVTIPDIFIDKNYDIDYNYDYGIDGIKSEYAINSYYEDAASNSQVNSFLSLKNTLNYGKWRLNNFSTAILKSSGEREWSSVRTFISREIKPLRSQIRLGDNFTSGELFSSVGFRGITIESDSRFLPGEREGYAPVIRGIAKTKSVVTIRQNGFVLYEKTVFPGEFTIDELNDTSYGGDLSVTVAGSDGQTQEYIVPYNSSGHLVRPGEFEYSATLGEVRDNTDTPFFGEVLLKHGVNNYLTAYGGIQLAEGSMYKSALLGSGFSTPLGAISMDATYAKAYDNDIEVEGYRLRGTYTKNFYTTGSQIYIGFSPYIEDSYFSFSNFLDSVEPGFFKEKRRIDFSLSQSLPNQYGLFNINASYSDRWNSDDSGESYRVSYSNQLGDINYSLSASQQEYTSGLQDRQVSLVLSLPLGGRSSTSMTYGVTFVESEEPSLALGLSGGDGDLSYRVNYDKTNKNDQFNASLTTRNDANNIDMSYSHDKYDSSIGLNVSGGMVIHSNGVTFSPSLGETIGLAHIQGGEGSDVNGNRINKNGYAIVSNLSPYRENIISVSPNSESLDLEIKRPVRKIIPALGAISKIDFETKNKHTLLISIKDIEEKTLPLGALVYNSSGLEVGSVGQKNKVLARVEEKNGALYVGFKERVFCEFKYSEGEVKENEISYLEKNCL
ncbi:fimbria/pilus outer membrane usher protein [Salinivibrio kushneri]|uniref:fimbria/pilus outer membrane usher protein n=1 Tax=Salinivibrio kushneri TaxID=1908198 RepID=UPI00098993A5|nr:fimbria/pilus outer membrane usher protein [Salinivibrio kushneri]OOE67729.1 hypothetical protein BZG19_10095 [Salinivibrio kushneri]